MTVAINRTVNSWIFCTMYNSSPCSFSLIEEWFLSAAFSSWFYHVHLFMKNFPYVSLSVFPLHTSTVVPTLNDGRLIDRLLDFLIVSKSLGDLPCSPRLSLILVCCLETCLDETYYCLEILPLTNRVELLRVSFNFTKNRSSQADCNSVRTAWLHALLTELQAWLTLPTTLTRLTWKIQGQQQSPPTHFAPGLHTYHMWNTYVERQL